MISPDYNTGRGAMGAAKVGAGSAGFYWLEQPVYSTFAVTGALVDGTSGTLKGIAPPNSFAMRTDTGELFQNTGTKNSPVWTSPSQSRIQPLGSVGTALTAVGSTRADALALTKQINNIGTAAGGTGVILPAAAIGNMIIVFNGGASAIKVYGAGSDTIDGAAAATGVTLTNAKRCLYMCVAAATYISAQLGVVSA